MPRIITFIISVFAAGAIGVAQSPDPSTVYTAAQAAAGKVEIQQNSFGACTDCHTSALTGRKGEPGEVPALASLPPDYQKLINGNGGKVPPLVGPEFIARWARRSTKALTAEFLDRFGPRSGRLSEETRLDIIAYMLQASGAKPGLQPLTMTTDIPIGSLVPPLALGISPRIVAGAQAAAAQQTFDVISVRSNTSNTSAGFRGVRGRVFVATNQATKSPILALSVAHNGRAGDGSGVQCGPG